MTRLSLLAGLVVSLLILAPIAYKAHADGTRVARGAAGPGDGSEETTNPDAVESTDAADTTADTTTGAETKTEDEAAAEPEDKPVKESAAKQVTQPTTTASTPTTPAVTNAAATATAASMDAEDELLFERIKSFVKKLDAADRKGIQFPAKAIDTAVRAEFLRRTEGNMGFSWIGNHKLKTGDMTMARGNLVLLIEFGEHLLMLSKKGKALKEKQLLEMKMMAAKAVIDDANARVGREPATTPERGTISAFGKTEMARRERLLGHLVAGNEYKAIAVRNIDEYGKRYKETLIAASKEYDKLAIASNTGAEPTRKTASTKTAPKKKTKK